jgi:hypothetical protein
MPPLLVTFHGATGVPGDMLTLLRTEAAQRKVLLLAPQLRTGHLGCHRGWHIRQGRGQRAARYGHRLRPLLSRPRPDRRRRLRLLRPGPRPDQRGPIHPRLAYSPGCIPPGRRDGRLTIFISHGRRDTILPLTNTSHRIVPALENDGFHVDYIEHDLGHQAPDSIQPTSAELLG